MNILRFTTLLFLIYGLSTSLKAQQVDEDFYKDVAANLCQHLDSLGEISMDGFIPLFVQMELGDLTIYLPQDQQSTIVKWDENSFLKLPFVNSLDGTRTFAHLIESCPAASDRFFEQTIQYTESDTLLQLGEWQTLLDFVMAEAAPKALSQKETTYLHALTNGIRDNEEARITFSKLKKVAGYDVLIQLLVAWTSRELPGVAIRHFPEKYESKKLEEYLTVDELGGILALVDTLKAQDDIDAFCKEWENEGGVDMIDTEFLPSFRIDAETRNLFVEYYDGPALSGPVLSMAPGVVVMAGVFTRCKAYKADMKAKGIQDVIEQLKPNAEEVELFQQVAEGLCDCVSMGTEGGPACLEKFLGDYNLTEEDMTSRDELSPEKEKLKTAIIAMLPGIALGCASE